MRAEPEAHRMVRVAVSHQPTHAEPLKVKAGDELALGRRDEEWPGWIWCTNADRKSSWVPESYFRIEGSMVTMLRDYDATEFTVREGEELQVEEEESGWLLCVSKAGRRGWVPKRNVEEIRNAI